MELRECIVQAVLLPGGKAVLLGEDAPEPLLCTEAVVEESFPVADALHYLHGEHVGGEQLQLVAAGVTDLPEQVERLVVAHLLVADVGHIVERLGLSVRAFRREGTGGLGCPEGGGDVGIAQAVSLVVVPFCQHRFALSDRRAGSKSKKEGEEKGTSGFHRFGGLAYEVKNDALTRM